MKLASKILSIFLFFILFQLFTTPTYAVYESYIYTLPTPAPITTDTQSVQTELQTKIQEMISAGHMAPTMYMNGLGDFFISSGAGQIFYDTPNETIYTLSVAYPYLTSAQQNALKTYLTSELSKFSPVSTGYYDGLWSGDATKWSGGHREYFPVNPTMTFNFYPGINVHPSVMYSVWAYSYYTNDWSYATTNYNAMKTLYTNLKTAGVKTYPELAGVIGFARIAQHQGNIVDYNDALSFADISFTNAVNFNQFLTNSKTNYPPAPAQYVAPVFMFSKYPIGLHFDRDINKFIHDQAASSNSTYLAQLEKDVPLAYINSSSISWGENTAADPDISWTDFMLRAARGDNQLQLKNILDKPDRKGDLLYIQKLVATIEAPAGSATPTPTSGGPTLTPTPVGSSPTPTPVQSVTAAHFSVQAQTVNNGFNDNVPRQLVRTASDKVYIFGGVVATGKINIFWNPNGGYPNATADFFGSASVTNPSAVFVVDGAYDGGSIIHILVGDMSGALRDYPFNTNTNTFSSAITVSTGDSTPVNNTDIGTTGVSSMFDSTGTLHIAYWASGNQVMYRSYTYNLGSNTLTLTSGPTRLDSSGTATHPELAVSPLDQSVTVAWVNGLSGSGTITARSKPSGGSWGSIENASTGAVWTSTNSGYNIDQGPSMVITTDGTKAFTYIENFGSCGTDYGRLHFVSKVNGASSWTDFTLNNFCTHADGLGIDSSNNFYAISHGHPSNPSCTLETQVCVVQRNSNGTWNNPTVYANPPAGDSMDDSVSTKWSAVGWNRPETIEFAFFDAIGGSYQNTGLWYGRLTTSGSPSGGGPTSTPTPIPTATPTPINTPTLTPTPTSIPPTNTPTPTITPTPVPTGDINRDGITNLVDLSIMLSNFNLAVTGTNKTSDLNNDGAINAADFSQMLIFLRTAGIIA